MANPLDWDKLSQIYSVSASKPMPVAKHRDETLLRVRREEYREFEKQRELTSYDHDHTVRFQLTVAHFWEHLECSDKIVELGGDSRIGVFAQSRFGCNYQSYERELREPFALDNELFDLVLCCEVIEHIKDRRESETDIQSISSFNYSGVLHVFLESARILRPGGVLLMTTPNASSIDVMVKVMRGDHPYLYDLHVREMAPKQIKAFGEYAGFVLEELGTFFAWGTADEMTRDLVSKFLLEMRYPVENRGDNAFFVFRKPEMLA